MEKNEKKFAGFRMSGFSMLAVMLLLLVGGVWLLTQAMPVWGGLCLLLFAVSSGIYDDRAERGARNAFFRGLQRDVERQRFLVGESFLREEKNDVPGPQPRHRADQGE